MSFSKNQLMTLAKTNPKELAKILNSPDADTYTLTFGAELLGGEVTEEEIVLPVIRRLLKHINALVREGAVVGIASFYFQKKPPQDILDKLTAMSTNDPSPVLRVETRSLLENFDTIK